MPVIVSCIRCGKHREVPDDALGSDIVCPVCEATMPLLQWVEATSIGDLANLTIRPQVIENFCDSLAREETVCPLAMRDQTTQVAVAESKEEDLVQKLRFILDRDIRLIAVPRDVINRAIARYYGSKNYAHFPQLTDTQKALTASIRKSPTDLQFFWLVMLIAVKDHATELLISRTSSQAKVLYWIDGREWEMVPPPAHVVDELAKMLNRPGPIRRLFGWRYQKLQDQMMTVREDGLDVRIGSALHVRRSIKREGKDLDIRLGWHADPFQRQIAEELLDYVSWLQGQDDPLLAE